MSAQNQQEAPIACNLSAQDLSVRQVENAEIMRGIQTTKELSDGYAVQFPGSAEWAKMLLQFVVQERACCPFFTFELHFEAQEGPAWLYIKGPEGAKEFIQEMIISSAKD